MKPEEQQKPERLWTPTFIAIVTMSFCCFMVSQGNSTGTSVYLSYTGGTAAFAGLLAGLFSAAAGGARLIVGPGIDRIGRFPFIFFGMAILLVSTYIPTLQLGDAALTVARFAQGFGFAACNTAAATAAADALPLSRLGEGISYFGLAQALAMSIGPAVALALAGTEPPENMFLGLSAIGVVALILTFGCRYEKHPDRLPATSAYRQRWERAQRGESAAAAPADEARGWRRIIEPRAFSGALPMVVISPAYGFAIFFMGLFGTHLGIANAGFFYTLSAVSMVAVRFGSKAYMDTVPPLAIYAVAIGAGALCFSSLLFVEIARPGYMAIVYYASGLLYGVCTGLSQPLNQSVSVKSTPPERWGAANALVMLAVDIGMGSGAVILGILNDSLGFTVTISVAIACVIASFVVALFTYPRK